MVAWYRPDGTGPDLDRDVDWLAVDLLDRAAVGQALDEVGPARIYHVAGAPQVDTSWQNVVPHLRANALATHHLLDAVRVRDEPCRVLVVSSALVYQVTDEPISEETALLPSTPYGLSKLAQDQLAQRACSEDGLDVVLARPFNHAGPGQSPAFAIPSFARQIARIEAGLAPPEIRVGNLDTRRDLTDVRDVVQAYVSLMESAPRGRPYNICSGSAWKIGDLLDELLQLSQTPVRVEVDQSRLRPNDVPVVQGDATRIRAEIGWVPKIRVEQMLRDTLEVPARRSGSRPVTPEIRRQLVHILAGAGALLLPWLTWWQAALIAAAGVFFNVIVLPRMAPSVFRPGDLEAPIRSGIIVYPLAVLALLICFPRQMEIAAAAWGILAAGDGMATLVGRHARTAPVPWNRAKSIGGLVSFVLFGWIAGSGLAAWTATGDTPLWWILVAPGIAALVAGFVETAPIRLNDNISVPAVAALVLWSVSLIDADLVRASLPIWTSRMIPAVALNVIVASMGYFARTVTLAGAVTGAVIGIAVYLGTGWHGWGLLFASFLATALATFAGFRRKAAAGIAEERGGRRGPGNALANTGVAAGAALLCLGVAQPALAKLAMVAALVTSASDSVASEVGKAWGKTTWLVVGFRRVSPGTPGAVSMEGTIAGLGAAVLLAMAAVGLELIPARWIAAVVVAATVAGLVEGALGSTLEARGTLNNDALNLINSMIGAALALGLVF